MKLEPASNAYVNWDNLLWRQYLIIFFKRRTVELQTIVTDMRYYTRLELVMNTIYRYFVIQL